MPRVAALVASGSLITCLCPSLQKCIRFNPDATVWVAKQRILCSLNQSLKDVLNYGLFQPASNGRDGKFLDEERLLREYPQPVGKGVPSLEVLGTAGGGPAPKPKCDDSEIHPQVKSSMWGGLEVTPTFAVNCRGLCSVYPFVFWLSI